MKKKKKGLAFRIHKKREGWKTVGEEEKAREKVSEGLGFLVFHSV